MARHWRALGIAENSRKLLKLSAPTWRLQVSTSSQKVSGSIAKSLRRPREKDCNDWHIFMVMIRYVNQWWIFIIFEKASCFERLPSIAVTAKLCAGSCQCSMALPWWQVHGTLFWTTLNNVQWTFNPVVWKNILMSNSYYRYPKAIFDRLMLRSMCKNSAIGLVFVDWIVHDWQSLTAPVSAVISRMFKQIQWDHSLKKEFTLTRDESL